jgi:DNA-binding CsgD family transcriptional regulator
MMLYISIVVVNLGYLLMSLASTVRFAVFSNDVAYLGSVFLSMFMLLTIVRLCGFEIKKAHVITCVSLGAFMFAIIVSSPMLPLYYKSVDIKMIDGAAKLVKEYGVLHPVYMVYLLGYFAAMIGTIIHSVRKKKIGKPKLAGFIAAIVCSNLAVWLLEKLVSWEYEFLSVTYIGSELLLLLVYWMMQDYVLKRDISTFTPAESEQLGIDIATMPMDVKIGKVLFCLKNGETLAPREREVLELILQYKKRREIAELLYVSESSVKLYTRTLYSKLGVTSREELYAILVKK